jgi:hypothetical protein
MSLTEFNIADRTAQSTATNPIDIEPAIPTRKLKRKKKPTTRALEAAAEAAAEAATDAT